MSIRDSIEASSQLIHTSQTYLKNLVRLAHIESKIFITRMILLGILSLAVGALLMSTWVILMVALGLELSRLGVSAPLMLSLVAVFNLLLLLSLGLCGRWHIQRLDWPRTRQQLHSFSLTTEIQETEHVSQKAS